MTTDAAADHRTTAAEFDIDAARKLALAIHLQVAADDVDVDITQSTHSDLEFEHGRQSYVVMTDAEADDAARESLRDSLWAFQSSFLRSYIPALRNAAAARAFDKMRETLCEDANELVSALLGAREDECLADAISADGRGHTLAPYDGEESEQRVEGVTFYIYRTN